MTREIKFRGKIAFGGYNGGDGWIYGNLTGSPTHPYIQEVKVLGNDFYHLPITEVAQKSIGQFTGLHDKNGKEIYEGDIIAVNGMQIGYIVGGVRGYCYDVIYTPAKSNGEKSWSLYSVVTIDYPNKCEVIGNIYDNPVLLKGGEQ